MTDGGKWAPALQASTGRRQRLRQMTFSRTERSIVHPMAPLHLHPLTLPPLALNPQSMPRKYLTKRCTSMQNSPILSAG